MSPGFAVGAVAAVFVLAWFFSALDRARWYSHMRRPRGRRSPDFAPIAFWRREGDGWYARRLAEFHLPPHAARAAHVRSRGPLRTGRR